MSRYDRINFNLFKLTDGEAIKGIKFRGISFNPVDRKVDFNMEIEGEVETILCDIIGYGMKVEAIPTNNNNYTRRTIDKIRRITNI